MTVIYKLAATTELVACKKAKMLPIGGTVDIGVWRMLLLFSISISIKFVNYPVVKLLSIILFVTAKFLFQLKINKSFCACALKPFSFSRFF